MTDLETAQSILRSMEAAVHPAMREVFVKCMAHSLAAARREGEEKMRVAAAQECVRHAKFCKDEAHKGGDWAHLMARFEEATYNAQRIRALPLTPEKDA